MIPLPSKLDHEPLVDAVFEVRMIDAPPLADILPGFLLHDLGKGPKVTRLPAADIPYPMRKGDANLQFAPTQRIDLEQFSILIGDRNVIVSCKLPYPKWANFKPMILDVMQRIAKAGLPGTIERYSLKYVNLIQAESHLKQINKINAHIKLGNLEVTEEHIKLQIHQDEGGVVHILSVSTGASGNIGGHMIDGIIVDIDSIRKLDGPNIEDLVNGLADEIESLRQSNKEKFFGCLTEETIEEMGPTYE